MQIYQDSIIQVTEPKAPAIKAISLKVGTSASLPDLRFWQLENNLSTST